MAKSRNNQKPPDVEQEQHEAAAFAPLLGDAFTRIKIPEGLQTRLQSRIRAEAMAASTRVTPVASQEVQFNPEESKSIRGSFSRRLFSYQSVLAIVATVSLLYFGFSALNRRLDSQQLAAHCVAELNELEATQVEWLTDRTPAWNITTTSLRTMGYTSRLSSRFGTVCILWKLQAENGNSVYVLEFQKSPTINNLTEQLRPIHSQTGSWSLAAMRDNDRVFVFAAAGSDVLNYVNPIPFA